MKYYMVTIRDNVAATYRVPACVPNIGGFLRSLGDEVNRAAQDNEFYKHPEDFEVFQLGSYDDETADFEILARPTSLALLKSMVREAH